MAKSSESQRKAVTKFRAGSHEPESAVRPATAPLPEPEITSIRASSASTTTPAAAPVTPPAARGVTRSAGDLRYPMPASLACSILAGLVVVRESDEGEPPPTVPPSPHDPERADATASPNGPTSAGRARPTAERPGAERRARRAGSFELGREHEASLESVLLAGFDDGTGDLAVGFLRHLSSELYLLSLRFCDVDRGLRDAMTNSNVERVLYRLSEQARAVAELQLRLKRERMRTDEER